MVVQRVDSDHTSSSSSSPYPPITAASSLSSSSSINYDDENDDIENGYSSQEENNNNNNGNSCDMEIISKFVSHPHTKMPRRLSQCGQLSYRPIQRRPSAEQSATSSSSSIDDHNTPSPNANVLLHATTPRNRLWRSISSTPSKNKDIYIGGCVDLPKTIFCQPSSSPHTTSSSSSSSNKKSYQTILLSLALLILSVTSSVLIYNQRIQIDTLKSEIQIKNSHNDYLSKSQSNLLSQLNDRTKSIEQYKHSHTQMNNVHVELSRDMKKLRNEYNVMKRELDRLKQQQGKK